MALTQGTTSSRFPYNEIYNRVREARKSETVWMHADMLTSSAAGRSVSKMHVKDLVRKISHLHGFDQLHALLVVEEEFNFVVVGGNHRLQVIVGVLPILWIPVKVINLKGVLDVSGEQITLEQHSGILVASVQRTESHPNPYSPIQEIVLFNDVLNDFKAYFQSQKAKLASLKIKISSFRHDASNVLIFYNNHFGNSIRLIDEEKNNEERRKVIKGMEKFSELGVRMLAILNLFIQKQKFVLTVGQIKTVGKFSTEQLDLVVKYVCEEVKEDSIDGPCGENWKPFTQRVLDTIEQDRKRKQHVEEQERITAESVYVAASSTVAQSRQKNMTAKKKNKPAAVSGLASTTFVNTKKGSKRKKVQRPRKTKAAMSSGPGGSWSPEDGSEGGDEEEEGIQENQDKDVHSDSDWEPNPKKRKRGSGSPASKRKTPSKKGVAGKKPLSASQYSSILGRTVSSQQVGNRSEEAPRNEEQPEKVAEGDSNSFESYYPSENEEEARQTAEQPEHPTANAGSDEPPEIIQEVGSMAMGNVERDVQGVHQESDNTERERMPNASGSAENVEEEQDRIAISGSDDGTNSADLSGKQLAAEEIRPLVVSPGGQGETGEVSLENITEKGGPSEIVADVHPRAGKIENSRLNLERNLTDCPKEVSDGLDNVKRKLFEDSTHSGEAENVRNDETTKLIQYLENDDGPASPVRVEVPESEEPIDVEEEWHKLEKYGKPLPGSSPTNKRLIQNMHRGMWELRKEKEKKDAMAKATPDGNIERSSPDRTVEGDGATISQPGENVSSEIQEGTEEEIVHKEIVQEIQSGMVEVHKQVVPWRKPAERVLPFREKGDPNRLPEEVKALYDTFPPELQDAWGSSDSTRFQVMQLTKRWCYSMMDITACDIEEKSLFDDNLLQKFINLSVLCQVVEFLVDRKRREILFHMDDLCEVWDEWFLVNTMSDVQEMKWRIPGQRFSVKITPHAIVCLKSQGRNALCDLAIMFLTQFIMREELFRGDTYVLPSILHGYLFHDREEDALERFLDRLPVRDMEWMMESNMILVPVHSSYHWVLVVIMGLRSFLNSERNFLYVYTADSFNSSAKFWSDIMAGIEDIINHFSKIARGKVLLAEELHRVKLCVPQQSASEESCGYRMVWHATLCSIVGENRLLDPMSFAEGWRPLQKAYSFEMFLGVTFERINHLLKLSSRGLCHFSTILFLNLSRFKMDLSIIFPIGRGESVLHEIDLKKFIAVYNRSVSDPLNMRDREKVIEKVRDRLDEIAIMVLQGSDLCTALLEMVKTCCDEFKDL